MKELALSLPGIGQVQGYPNIDKRFDGATLGTLITEFSSLALLIAGVLMFVWFVWGVFDYLLAGGNKENIGKARKKMTWAIVGFILFTISFSASQYASTLLKPVERQVNPKGIQRDSSSTQQNTAPTKPVTLPGGANNQGAI